MQFPIRSFLSYFTNTLILPNPNTFQFKLSSIYLKLVHDFWHALLTLFSQPTWDYPCGTPKYLGVGLVSGSNPFWEWPVWEWFIIFRKIHEVWRPKTLQKMFDFWNFLLSGKRLTPFINEILVFPPKVIFFSAQWVNCKKSSYFTALGRVIARICKYISFLIL